MINERQCCLLKPFKLFISGEILIKFNFDIHSRLKYSIFCPCKQEYLVALLICGILCYSCVVLL